MANSIMELQMELNGMTDSQLCDMAAEASGLRNKPKGSKDRQFGELLWKQVMLAFDWQRKHKGGSL